MKKDCGFWTCTSWVTDVRHYSRDYGAKHTTVIGRHRWGGISLSSATIGFKDGSIALVSNDTNCVITAGSFKSPSATFEGGGKVCSAKSNFVVYHDESSTQAQHTARATLTQMTVEAS